MKLLKIDGEIMLPNEMSLEDFCIIFNKFQDENKCGFNGFIKDKETTNDD